MKATKRNLFILGFVLLTALLITYSNHWHNGFHFDDSHTIVENVHIQNIKNIPKFFYDPRTESSKSDRWGLRPFVTTSLAIDYWLGGGLNPVYFHLSTFIWFVLIGLLLFFVYTDVFRKGLSTSWLPYLALIGVAWYMLHPANAETINYIISRSDVISTLCIVASLFLYISLPHLRRYYIYVIPAAVGGLTKESGFVIVPILFFYVLLFEKNWSVSDIFRAKNFKELFKTVVSLLPIVLVILACQSYTLLKAPPAPGNLSNPFVPYLLTQAYVWLHYFITFFLPTQLSADTDLGVLTLPDYRIAIGLLFVAFLIYITFRTSRNTRTRPIAFGLLWFMFSLLPTSLAPLAEVTNDHRMFLPFIGLCLSVVYSIGLLIANYAGSKMRSPVMKPAFFTVVVLILSAYAYGTYQRNEVWRTEETLWHDVTIKSPRNGRGWMNYGLTQMEAGKFAQADSAFQQGLRYAPNYSTMYINMGILKNAMGKPAEAEPYFRKAIELMPWVFEPYHYYARFLNRNNRTEEAKAMAKKALDISPYFMDSRYLLMDIYQQQEQWDSLKAFANNTLSIAPNDKTTLGYLQASNERKSKLDQAIINTATNTPEAYLNLSLEFYNKKQWEKCIEACQEAIKLKPDYADAYSNMCAAYNNLKQFNKAIEACNTALKIDPKHKLANGNLNWAKSQVKK